MKFFNNHLRKIIFCILSIAAIEAYSSPASQFDFIALADFHFDPFTICNKKNDCPMIEKLRNAKTEEWPKVLAQYDIKMPQYGEDTTWPLLASALSASKDAANKKHAQFVLVLGDFMGHNFYSKYKMFTGDRSASGYSAFSRKFFKFLTQQLAAAFPDTSVYMVVGNNDSYNGDYTIKPSGQFFNDMSTFWSSLIMSSENQTIMKKEFLYAGYYSLVLPDSENLQLIVMNSNLFSNKAKGKNLAAAALKQLDWLHGQLQDAKNAGRHVFIAMHMPEGVDLYATPRIRLFRLHALWKPQYINRFDDELKQFSAVVAGVFSGHVHHNWFQLRTLDGNEIPMIGVVAVSPISGNDPGFRDISYFTNPLHLDNMVTYSYPLISGTNWIST